MQLAKIVARTLLATVAVVAANACPPASAATGPWAGARGVRARLVAATDGPGYAATLRSGLEVELGEGWDTYWRSPGDAGAPPVVDWSDSRNASSVSLRFPAPSRTEVFGLQTVGYTGAVTFPLEVRPDRPGDAVSLRAKVDMLVCKDICQPVSFRLELDIPAGGGAADPGVTAALARAEASVPGNGRSAGLSVTAVDAAAGGAAALTVKIASLVPLVAPDVFVESGGLSFGKPRFALSPDGLSATAEVDVTSGPDAVGLPGTRATVTLVDGVRASETAVRVGGGTPGAWTRLLSVLPFLVPALAGGLLLNLMPCVLPVLAMKLFAATGHVGRPRGKVRRSFLASAAGIVASMLASAGILSCLKAAGLAAGWGIQFQQPGFLVGVSAALLVFSSAMAGGLELGLPGKMVDILSRAGSDGLAGSFVAGAFATLLATPCSAPFVGTAVAFALARGPGETVAIFAALGIGMATPYLAVAAFPGLASSLPRPGRWMLALRRVLGCALALTAAWLLWILAGQVPAWAAAVACVALVAMVGIIRLRDSMGHVAAAAGAVTCLFWALAATELAPAPAAVGNTAGWTAFDAAGIGRDVAEGKVVFVDVTAGWCATCIANRGVVLGRRDVATALARPDVVAMMADWTRADAGIMAYLARNGRFGIPFNAVYGPGAPHGIVLSELLTGEAVLSAIDRAGKPGMAGSNP